MDQTTFLKQYKEYGLPYPACRRRDGHGAILGRRPGLAVGPLAEPVVSRPEHSPRRRPSPKRFREEVRQPPDNQAWGDYVGVRIVVQTIAETKAPTLRRLVQYLEKGAEFDMLKARKGKFRDWDHQLLQEMYVVKVKDKSKSKDKWDIFEIVETGAGPRGVAGADPADAGGKPLQPAGGVSRG